MKLLKKMLLIFVTSFALLSCNNEDIARETDIYTPQIALNEKYDKNKNYATEKVQNYTLPIMPLAFEKMFESKEDFIFYFHNIECEHCERIKPNLIRYILETKNTFYSMDIGDDLTFMELSKHYQDIKDQNDIYLFKDESGAFSYATPVFFVIKDGKIFKKQLVTENMFSYKYFAKVMAKYFITSASYVLKNLDDLKNYRYVFYYDNSKENYVSIYRSVLAQDINSLAIVRLDIVETDKTCQIINQETTSSFIISETTTLEDTLSFLNN